MRMRGMTNYRNGGRLGHNGPPGTAKEVTGRFAPSSVRPLDVSPPRRFALWTVRPHVVDVSPPSILGSRV